MFERETRREKILEARNKVQGVQKNIIQGVPKNIIQGVPKNMIQGFPKNIHQHGKGCPKNIKHCVSTTRHRVSQ